MPTGGEKNGLDWIATDEEGFLAIVAGCAVFFKRDSVGTVLEPERLYFPYESDGGKDFL